MPAVKGKKQSKTSPRALATAKKRADAITMRIQGFFYHQIGAELKVSAVRAYQLCQEGFRDLIEDPVEKARSLSIARCDAMLSGFMPAAMKGDQDALNAVLRIEERRDRLLGILTQVDHRHTVEGTVGVSHSGGVKHTMELVFVEPAHDEPMTIDHDNAVIDNVASDNA